MENRPDSFAGTGPLAAAPTEPVGREGWLDALRGLALFGILWINMAAFSSPFLYTEAADIRLFADPTSVTVEWLRSALVQGKFYPLFSWLFGLGIGWQLTRGWSNARLMRRLVILSLFGLIHAVLFFYGDVLLVYAGMGFLILAFAGSGDAAVRRWGMLFLAAPAVLSGGLALLLSLVPPEEWARMRAADGVAVHQYLRVFRDGGFGEILTYRVRDYLTLLSAWFGWLPTCLGMMLIGLWCGRRRAWENPRWRKAMYGLGVGGLLLNGLFLTLQARATETPSVVVALWQSAALSLAGPMLVLAGVALFYRVLRQRTSWLAPAGRMAFSNYLAQSVICSLLFNGYGLGLYGKVPPLAQLGLAIVIFAGQVCISHWWLGRFRFGPLEWLWRSASYRTWLPLKASPPSGNPRPV